MKTLSLLALSLLLNASIWGGVPVTKPLEQRSGDIRFVVMADRTGGMQPGVFRDAIAKANLLHPEFVICVGDLIDGYTLDPAVIEAQYTEFDAMVEAIDMHFFYVPGNHDISNPWMEAEWRKRRGDPYYSFVYKDVLFIALHTEDGGHSGISEAQSAFVAATLQEHADVRWTFLFMHRPLWSYEDQEGFAPIAAALEGRRYTLFSGHHHNYFYDSNGGNERFILATSGGGSDLRGEAFGEFHHLTHVALTEQGPKVALVSLDGFVSKEIVNTENRPRVEALRQGSFFSVAPVVADSATPQSLRSTILCRNETDQAMVVAGTFPAIPGVSFEPATFAVEVPAHGEKPLHFTLRPKSGHTLDLATLGPVNVTATGSFQLDAGEPLSLSTSKPWRSDYRSPLRQVESTPRIDGDLTDWVSAVWQNMDTPGYATESWDWHGPEDCTLRFAIAEDSQQLIIAAEADDDRFLFLDGPLRDQFTFYFELPNGVQHTLTLSPNADGTLVLSPPFEGIEAACTIEGRLLQVELAIPKATMGITSETHSIRMNLSYLDHDNSQNQKPSILYWQPAWGSPADFADTGTFERE